MNRQNRTIERPVPDEPVRPPATVGPDIDSLERRFWVAESKWADKGSGMTEDQRTGAHMAFLWLRTADRP